MSVDNQSHSSSDGVLLLRNEPVQARSTARLASLLEAAAAVVDEVGYERLTTALVAERAGASIGTVYRYFPDRIVVLQGLSARFVSDSLDQVSRIVREAEHVNWWEAFDAVLSDLVESFRDVPGFRSLRFGDVLDLGPDAVASGVTTVAGAISSGLAERFELTDDDDLQFRLSVSLDIVDVLLSRAFADGAWDRDRLVAEAREIARNYLMGFYGDPRT